MDKQIANVTDRLKTKNPTQFMYIAIGLLMMQGYCQFIDPSAVYAIPEDIGNFITFLASIFGIGLNTPTFNFK